METYLFDPEYFEVLGWYESQNTIFGPYRYCTGYWSIGGIPPILDSSFSTTKNFELGNSLCYLFFKKPDLLIFCTLEKTLFFLIKRHHIYWRRGHYLSPHTAPTFSAMLTYLCNWYRIFLASRSGGGETPVSVQLVIEYFYRAKKTDISIPWKQNARDGIRTQELLRD